MMLKTFPVLPPDIERLIFECSAYHDRSMALKLVDPILYRHVTLEFPSQAEAFVRAIETSNKPSSFFLNQVKILCCAYGIELRHLVGILSACRGVVSLASWLELSQITCQMNAELEAFSKLVTSGSLRLHRLSIILHDFLRDPDPDFSITALAHITHLDIYQESDYFYKWTWRGFHGLSYLTHLSFDINLSTPFDTALEVLLHCPPGLRICLVLLSTRNSNITIDEYCNENTALLEIAAGRVDSRLVVGTSELLDEKGTYGGLIIVHPYEEVLKDWSFTPDGKNDIWEKAENVMAWRSKRHDSETYQARRVS